LNQPGDTEINEEIRGPQGTGPDAFDLSSTQRNGVPFGLNATSEYKRRIDT
jgi:hypothetical protein